MKKASGLYDVNTIINISSENLMNDGFEEWVPSRPIGTFGFLSRCKKAWMVFTGKADALIWPKGQ